MRRNHSVPTMIVDKNALFRIGLAHSLAKTRFRVIAEYSLLSEITTGSIPSAPCLLLIGIDHHIDNSIKNFLKIKENRTEVRIALLGDQLDEADSLSVIELDSDFYIHKNAIIPDLFTRSLELVMAGEVVFSRELMQRVRSQWALRSPQAAPTGSPDASWKIERIALPVEAAQLECRLSERETAILMRVMHGASNKLIARELDIAEATVKVHVKSVLRKIRVKNRTQAATWAWSRYSHQDGAPSTDVSDTPVGLTHSLDDISAVGKTPNNPLAANIGSSLLPTERPVPPIFPMAGA
jgi:two-component system, NarL family, nitrate/nitrite response regulator NarL